MENLKDVPGQNKEIIIIVNTREKTFIGKEISFRQVVELAFSNPVYNDSVRYTLSYSKGVDKKPKGTMVDGDVIHVKEGMVFDVDRADRS